jgi:hypothetical protein
MWHDNVAAILFLFRNFEANSYYLSNHNLQIAESVFGMLLMAA